MDFRGKNTIDAYLRFYQFDPRTLYYHITDYWDASDISSDSSSELLKVAATQASGVDWPHDSIAQHEISHYFNADDGGTWPWEHPECIMNYYYAWQGTDKWCDEHQNVVYGNINGLWE